MGGTFLSGGSGCGKTTFCKTVAAKHPEIKLVIDVIRTIHQKHPYISYLPTNERQLVYATEYIKVHQSKEFPYFLSDRSLLNVLTFWKMNPKVVSYLDLDDSKPDLLILIPVPPYDWYEKHVSYFSDPIRISTYKQRAGITREELASDEISGLFYQQDLDMYNSMRIMCENLEWNYFVPSIDAENFQSSWQRQAEDEVIATWFNPKLRKMVPRVVPIEEYEKHLKRMEGGFKCPDE